MPPKTKTVTEMPKGRTARVMQILAAMTQDERAEFFEEVGATYCTTCAEELPEENSKEPDHDCPFEDDEDEDGDDGDPDEEEDEEEGDDEEANEP